MAWAVSTSFFALLTGMMLSAGGMASSIRGGYWPSWSSSPPSSIETSLYTHLSFAFVPLSNTFSGLEVSDSTASAVTAFVNAVRAKSTTVKTLISIGGGESDVNRFAAVFSDPVSRRQFINSTIHVARRFGLDGLDLDWEFPRNSSEMENLGALLNEWRKAVELECRSTGKSRLQLTAAVYFSPEFFLSAISRTYPVDSLGRNLDVINVMCYDYRGSWDTTRTGSHAAFRDPNSRISTSYGLGLWIQQRAPRDKLAMGLPLYGRTWTLRNPDVNGIEAPAVGAGPGNGVLLSSEVDQFNEGSNAIVIYDNQTVSTYSFSGTSWVGYDDSRSAVEKVRLARNQFQIGGYFFWAVGYDTDSKITREVFKAWK